MYAGSGVGDGGQSPDASGGAFKTTDGGAHWLPINKGLREAYVDAIWVDQSNPDNVVLGTESTGIYHSTDGGSTWIPAVGPTVKQGNQTTTSAAPSGAADGFALSDSTLLAAMTGGVAASTDGGTTWSLIYPTSGRVLQIAATNGVVAIGTQIGRVLTGPQGGASFSVVLTGLGGSVQALAVDPANPSTMFAGVGGNPGSLRVSTNAGSAWTTLSPPAQPQALSIPPDTHAVLEGTATGLYTSNDNGQSWKLISPSNWNVRKVYTRDDATIIVGTDEGAYETANGGARWVSLTGNIDATLATGVAASGSTILLPSEGSVPLISFDGGATWSQSTAQGQNGAALVHGAIWYVFTGSGLQYSTEFGQTFAYPSGVNGSYTQLSGSRGGNIIAFDPFISTTFYVAASNGVYQSPDLGKTLVAKPWGFTNVYAIAVSPVNHQIILVGTATGLSRTSDGGQTWTPIDLPGASGYPNTIAFNPADPHSVLVGMSNGADKGGGILRSSDDGQTFGIANTGLPTTQSTFAFGNVENLAISFSPTGTAALAMNSGLFLSNDGGLSWQNFTSNAVSHFFSDVTWDGPYNLYAATYGSGVLRMQPAGPSPLVLSVDATSFSFEAPYGSTTRFPVNLNISASGGASAQTLVNVASTSGTAWISAGGGTFGTPSKFGFFVDPTNLTPGTYTAQVTISSSWTNNGPIVIPITLVVDNPTGATPIIYPNGVVPIFSKTSKVSPTAWMSIYGYNLAPQLSVWDSTYPIPTKLAGVTVAVNGKPAYLWFVSPLQINFQAPNDQFSGPVQVVVTTPAGTASATVTMFSVSPSLNMFDTRYPAAIIPVSDGSGAYQNGTYDELGPAGRFSFNTRPVRVGETLVLYGTGFGSPQGDIAGQPLNTAIQLGTSHLVTVGGIQADVSYVGLVAPGLYQINMTVPDVPAGDNLLRVNIAGTDAPAGIYIPVQ